MWINENTKKLYQTTSQIREDFPNSSLPRNLGTNHLEFLNVSAVAVKTPPTYNEITHKLTLSEPIKDGGAWKVEWIAVPLSKDIVDGNISRYKENLIQQATEMRWSVMTDGITIPPGIRVGTTVDDQNRITSVVANAALAGLSDEDEVDFKASSGWVKITIGQVKSIAGIIGQFVQACYSAERTHHEAIAALETPEEIVAYDIEAGWPGA